MKTSDEIKESIAAILESTGFDYERVSVRETSWEMSLFDEVKIDLVDDKYHTIILEYSPKMEDFGGEIEETYYVAILEENDGCTVEHGCEFENYSFDEFLEELSSLLDSIKKTGNIGVCKEYRKLPDGQIRLNTLMELDNTADGDIEQLSLFYIVANNSDLFEKKDYIYDFNEHRINLECLDSEEVDFCSSSKKLIRLAFNLCNGYRDECVSPLDILSGLDKDNQKIALDAINIRLGLLKI